MDPCSAMPWSVSSGDIVDSPSRCRTRREVMVTPGRHPGVTDPSPAGGATNASSHARTAWLTAATEPASVTTGSSADTSSVSVIRARIPSWSSLTQTRMTRTPVRSGTEDVGSLCAGSITGPYRLREQRDQLLELRRRRDPELVPEESPVASVLADRL